MQRCRFLTVGLLLVFAALHGVDAVEAEDAASKAVAQSAQFSSMMAKMVEEIKQLPPADRDQVLRGVGSQSVMEKLQGALLGKSGTGAGDTKDTMFLVHLLMAVIEGSGGVDALFGGGGAQMMPTTPAAPSAPSIGKKTG